LRLGWLQRGDVFSAQARFKKRDCSLKFARNYSRKLRSAICSSHFAQGTAQSGAKGAQQGLNSNKKSPKGGQGAGRMAMAIRRLAREFWHASS
jgi:hypothetical protein